MKNLIKRYGVFGFIRLVYEKILTIIFFQDARLVRRPFEIRGRQNISIGKNFATGRYCRVESHNDDNNLSLIIGDNCQINDSVHISSYSCVEIGDNVLIASRVFITDLNHGSYSGTVHSNPCSCVSERPLSSSPVIIGDNVWLGEGAVVLPGVTIGNNVVVGANSLVSRNIPENSIAVGSPAVVIKVFCDEDKVWKLYE